MSGCTEIAAGTVNPIAGLQKPKPTAWERKVNSAKSVRRDPAILELDRLFADIRTLHERIEAWLTANLDCEAWHDAVHFCMIAFMGDQWDVWDLRRNLEFLSQAASFAGSITSSMPPHVFPKATA
jgi:hypothetical protein